MAVAALRPVRWASAEEAAEGVADAAAEGGGAGDATAVTVTVVWASGAPVIEAVLLCAGDRGSDVRRRVEEASGQRIAGLEA